jgi:hypothetical protein
MSTDVISSSMDASGYYQYEIASTRMMTGTPDEVRPRLAEALERLGFHVVEERPLVAQRRTGGWASAGCAMNVVESPATVHVKIKEAGSGASLVTFTYSVKALALPKGDRRVISHEVDAIVALARSREGSGICGRCSTDIPDDSRFCRRCGTPVAAAAPAEVDLYRLVASATNVFQLSVSGIVCLLLTLVLLVIGIWLAPTSNPAKAMKWLMLLSIFASAFGAIGLTSLLMAARRLGRSLRNVGEGEAERSPAYLPAARQHETAQLMAPAEPVSVTEGTTSLLEHDEAPPPRESHVRVRNTA